MKNHKTIFWFIMFRTKTLIAAKPLRIMFNKPDGFFRDYGGTKY